MTHQTSNIKRHTSHRKTEHSMTTVSVRSVHGFVFCFRECSPLLLTAKEETRNSTVVQWQTHAVDHSTRITVVSVLCLGVVTLNSSFDSDRHPLDPKSVLMMLPSYQQRRHMSRGHRLPQQRKLCMILWYYGRINYWWILVNIRWYSWIKPTIGALIGKQE